MWYTATGRRTICARPDPYGTTRISLCFMTDTGFRDKDSQEQIEYLRQKFSGAGWETQRILDALDSCDDLYCEDLTMVKMPRYSSGRVALIGDAAFCATPVSGKGTTLSLSSAYILAAELAKSPSDHLAAFKSYETVMRPIATKAQGIPSFIPGIVHPDSWLAREVLNTVTMIVGTLVSVVFSIPWPGFIKNRFADTGLAVESDRSGVPVYKELQRYL